MRDPKELVEEAHNVGYGTTPSDVGTLLRFARDLEVTLSAALDERVELRKALQSALGLCDYLVKHWPEVGSLPSVISTRCELAAALGWGD